MDLSIIATLYRSAPHLEEFCARMARAAEDIPNSDYEIILVNDGSPDRALDMALELQCGNPRLKVVDLSRNFGHHPAMMMGLAQARGKLVFLIDSDLQEDPELLRSFHQVLRDQRADVVYGVQDDRQGSWFDRVSGALFYKFFNFLSTDPIPPNLMTVRLMTRRYVDALLEHREVELLIAGLWARTGFRQLGVPVQKKPKKGTTYHLMRKISLMVTAVTSFSNKPLVFIFYLGILIFLCATVGASVLIARRLLFDVIASGWLSIIVSIWMASGLVLFGQGVLGIYLAKIFLETKRRPIAIIRQIYEADSNQESTPLAG